MEDSPQQLLDGKSVNRVSKCVPSQFTKISSLKQSTYVHFTAKYNLILLVVYLTAALCHTVEVSPALWREQLHWTEIWKTHTHLQADWLCMLHSTASEIIMKEIIETS